MKLTADEMRELELRRKLDRIGNQYKLETLYPDTGTLSRAAYPKHMEYFAAGKTHLARAAIAANRVGKTTMSAFETTLHLTGIYPDWWPGRRFKKPVEWWAASDTGETTRDILQFELLGKIDHIGTGMIPKEYIIGEPSRRRGVSDAVDTVRVKHVSGGESSLAFKSYDQGRAKFQGTRKDGVSLDEEPPVDVYTECLTRLMATVPGEEDGTMICTFTPLQGMSAVVLMFLNEPDSTRFITTFGFDDAPHLSAESKAKLLASYPPHERDARTKGIPQLGSGAIYPVEESNFLTDDFPIPAHWPRVYGMDVGWNKTAVPWLAWDRETDTVYVYAEHYVGLQEPSLHAEAIKARGVWIPGVIDPASRGRTQDDGIQLLQKYKDQGLDLETARNGVESGIFEVFQRLSTGRLKVFRSCVNWISEFRLYRRDKHGKVVKEKDHLMDGTRYGIVSGLERAIVKPPNTPENSGGDYGGNSGGWMSG